MGGERSQSEINYNVCAAAFSSYSNNVLSASRKLRAIRRILVAICICCESIE